MKIRQEIRFGYTNKRYKHNSESVLENDIQKLLWDFEIQTDHLVSARRPDLVIINKTITYQIVDFNIPADHRVKLKSEKKDKYLNLAREQKETIEHKGNGDTSCNWCTWNDLKRISKWTRRFTNQRTSRDHPNYNITKIGQNTEESPGDLRTLAVIQTPVKNHQLMLVWKTLKVVKWK